MKKIIITIAILFSINAQISAQLTESFEGTFPPAGWYKTTNWGQSTSQAIDGTKSARCIYSALNDTLITPALDLSSGSYTLFFQWKELSGNIDNTTVKYSTNNGISWTELTVIGGGSNNIWIQEEIALPNTAGSTQYKLMWNYQSDGTTLNSFYLDQVVVSSATTISNNEAFKNINIFPIPSNGTLSIENIPTNSSIEMFNQTGSLIYSQSNTQDNATKILIEDLAPGAYYIKVINNSNFCSKKILVF